MTFELCKFEGILPIFETDRHLDFSESKNLRTHEKTTFD